MGWQSSVPSQSPIRPLGPVPAHNSPHLEGVQVRADHVIDLPANYGKKESIQAGVSAEDVGTVKGQWGFGERGEYPGRGGGAGDAEAGICDPWAGFGARGGTYDSRLRFLGGGQGAPGKAWRGRHRLTLRCGCAPRRCAA